MKNNLNISKEVSLPKNVVTQTMAFLGRKGAGKTYLATLAAEGMLDMHAQVVVMDPVGNWWGLRVAADGKSKGKEIFVIGGDHGDVPLVPEAGARIAKLVVEKGISAVLDVSGFRIGEHKRFAAEFAEEFFHLKKQHRSPVHMFVEEAQKLIPQRVGPDEARMVGAFEQIVRLGRNYGIGCSLVSQRPQSINKEVLSQIECLFALQMTGPHERKALDEWVQEAGADRTLVNELPGLAQGEGYVWSPSWLRMFKRVHFNTKETFDASATPEVGKKTRAASISAVDVELLKKDMADVVAKAESDNPKLLKKKIQELTQELQKKPASVPQVAPNDPKVIDRAVQVALQKAGKDWDRVVQAWKKRHESAMKVLSGAFQNATSPIDLPTAPVGWLTPSNLEKKLFYKQIPAKPIFSKEDAENFNRINKPFLDIALSEKTTDILLSKSARDILAYLQSVYPEPRSKTQMWVATGYSPSGSFNNSVYELTGANLIIQEGGKYLAKQKVDGFVASLDRWINKLGLASRKIFQLMLENPFDVFSKEHLAQNTGYAPSGSFNNNIYTLTGAELIKKSGAGYIINPEILEL